ncbi:hypothetical protein Mgra_00008597 [Meloidogyne graminicola]|uniref:Uncharacterized protein n=1 Tax=Meloidogyne graminicola TaxID=189291 RepID=A0A8S9ZF82_9BILA|nr:hypothetical protein Mgra_00008597 [Meloidogyne graminicola]
MRLLKYLLLQLVLILIIYQELIEGLPSFHHQTFEIACSRFYGTESKPSHNTIFYSIIYYKLYGMLKFSKKSSRETIWNLLARLFVPLPRWKRGEILLMFCQSVYSLETTGINGSQLENCFNYLFDKNNKGFAGIKKGRMYNAAADLYKKIILKKSAILGEMLFEALESNELKTVYKIVFGRSRHEILPLLEGQEEFYPFEGKLEKIYLEKKFTEEKGEMWNNTPKSLEKHIKFKKFEANNSMKKVYDLLLKRIDAILGKRLLDDFEYISHLNSLCDLCRESTVHNLEILNQLIRLIENIVIFYEFKSENAREFGHNLQLKDNQSVKCLKNLIEFKVIMGKSNKNLTLQTNGSDVERDTQQISTAQLYLNQLKIIMTISMLTEGKYYYYTRLQKELQTIHIKGNHSEAIEFLFLHIDDDMSEILAKYPEKELKKDLEKFEKIQIGANNFFYAYENILFQIKNESPEKHCYVVTEIENALFSELKQLQLESDEVEIPTANNRELIETNLFKKLYELNSSQLINSSNFYKIIDDYLSNFSMENNWHLIIKLKELISEEDKIFPYKFAEISSELEMLKQKYSSSLIESIGQGNITRLNESLKNELIKWGLTGQGPSSSNNMSDSSSSEREVIKKIIDEKNKGKEKSSESIVECNNHHESGANNCGETSDSTNEILLVNEAETIPISFPALTEMDEVSEETDVSNLQMGQEKNKPKFMWSKFSNLWNKRKP